MKKHEDPRHLKRIHIVGELFAYSFSPRQKRSAASARVIRKLAQIDTLIEGVAVQWPLPKISKIDLAVLRLAICELVIDKKEPPKVIIDEAVEIAKTFGNEKSGSFVNGVLGTIITSNSPEVWTQSSPVKK